MFDVFGNSTDIVSWVDDPARRGTLQILSSCIVTILLCVWTALHLNLPCQTNVKQSWYAKRQLWRKIGWQFLSLLAPEMTVYVAWSQHREAKRVKKLNIKGKKRARDDDARSQSHHEETVRSQSILEHEEWGMVHAFYAIMGGFVIEMDSEKSFLPGQRRRMTLTTKGLQFIAERFQTLLPDLPEEDIADKSKQGALAKSIVCIQASWFIAQCISRLSTALPITLLELNTLGHSICALIIYIFWWQKPLDVEQPIVIRGNQAEQLLAFFWMSTDGLPVTYREGKKAEVRYLSIPTDEDKQAPTEQTPNEPSGKEVGQAGRQFYRPSVRDAFSNMLPTYQSRRERQSVEGTSTTTKLAKGKKLEHTSIRNDHQEIVLEQEDVRRWQIAETLLTEHLLRRRADDSIDGQVTITDRSRNWPSIDLDPKKP